MLYHVSVALDYSDHDLIVGQIQVPYQLNQHVVENSHSTTVSPVTEKENPLATKINAEAFTYSKNLVQENDLLQFRNKIPSTESESNRSNNFEYHRNSSGEVRNRTAAKEKFAVGGGSYEILSSSTESMPRWPDHRSAATSSVQGECQTPCSEYAVSSSPAASSLSRSTSSFSAEFSSVGESTSTSLEGIHHKNNKGDSTSTSLEGIHHKNNKGDSLSEKLLSDDENNTDDCFSSSQSNAPKLTQEGRSQSRTETCVNERVDHRCKTVEQNSEEIRKNKTVTGENSLSSLETTCTVDGSITHATMIDSCDLSFEGNSSDPTVRQILNSIPENSESLTLTSSGSEKVLTGASWNTDSSHVYDSETQLFNRNETLASADNTNVNISDENRFPVPVSGPVLLKESPTTIMNKTTIDVKDTLNSTNNEDINSSELLASSSRTENEMTDDSLQNKNNYKRNTDVEAIE